MNHNNQAIKFKQKTVSEHIPGYSYGSSEVAKSPVSIRELTELNRSAGFTEEDVRYLRLAGEVLADQTKRIVEYWRGTIIASIPHLARHSQTPEGNPLPEYLENSNLRFQQWILDTCLRHYDQDWANYQQEIALRQMPAKKNQTDSVRSTAYVPFRDVLAFVAVINETMKTYLAARGHLAREVERMRLVQVNPAANGTLGLCLHGHSACPRTSGDRTVRKNVNS